MKDRIKLTEKGYIMQDIDWIELVEKPFDEGRIIEAFASADAIIDDFIENCLRQIYEDFKCQDLINEIHLLRGQANFDGLVLLEILKSKGVVKEDFCQRVRMFKKARNLVLHNREAEYALVLGNTKITYSNQDELNAAVQKEAKQWIAEAFRIFDDLVHFAGEIDKQKDYYFSEKFYQEHPRGKVIQNQFPKTLKTKSSA